MKPETFAVRHFETGDMVSAELLDKWALLPLDRKWVWVVEHEDAIKAVLIAAPMHGMVFLLRIGANEDAPGTWLLTLLRTVMAECKERGYIAMMTYLTMRPEEQKLLRIANREGWYTNLEVGYWAIGSTECKH